MFNIVLILCFDTLLFIVRAGVGKYSIVDLGSNILTIILQNSNCLLIISFIPTLENSNKPTSSSNVFISLFQTMASEIESEFNLLLIGRRRSGQCSMGKSILGRHVMKLLCQTQPGTQGTEKHMKFCNRTFFNISNYNKMECVS